MKNAFSWFLPERVDNIVSVRLSENEAALYKRLERDMLLPFEDGDIDAVNVAALSNMLLQMANASIYDEQRTRNYITPIPRIVARQVFNICLAAYDV